MLVGAERSERVVNSVLSVGIGDLGVFNLGSLVLNGEDAGLDLGLGGGGLEHLSGGVSEETLLWLLLVSWENDKLALVGLEAGNISVELLLAGAGSSVVDRDTNSLGLFGTDSSMLKLNKSEAAAITNLTSILAGGL